MDEWLLTDGEVVVDRSRGVASVVETPSSSLHGPVWEAWPAVVLAAAAVTVIMLLVLS